MAQLASLPHAVDPLSIAGDPLAGDLLAGDPLAGDYIDFDAWLLPPETPSRLERVIHSGSVAAGPAALVGALLCLLRWIV